MPVERSEFSFKFIVVVLLLLRGMSFQALSMMSNASDGFVFGGFTIAAQNMSLDGVADITDDGLLRLTNYTMYQVGHAFYDSPFQFKENSFATAGANGKKTNSTTMVSFSTTFVFIVSGYYLSGQGIAFVLAPQRELPGSKHGIYLGLFNETNNGKASNHVVAVELDTISNNEFDVIKDNHVGIDINGLVSVESKPAAHFDSKNGGRFTNLSLITGEPIQVWIEYDGLQKQLNVTLAPISLAKPEVPLLSLSKDLSTVIKDSMYVGFASSTGSILSSHYILGWSFQIDGEAQKLNLAQLPKPHPRGPVQKSKLGLPIFIVLSMIFGIILLVITRKRKYAELVEDWELNIYGKQRFSYKDLYIATKGFKERELLGFGGFGRVYKGVLPSSNIDIAVKRISHNSKQGLREFIAEI